MGNIHSTSPHFFSKEGTFDTGTLELYTFT